MTDTVSRVQHIEGLLTRALSPRDSQVEAQVKRDSLGWLHVKVVTSLFEKQEEDERQDQINTILKEINLQLEDYPFATFRLLTPQEAAEQPRPFPVQMPLWSEILSILDIDEEVLQLAEENNGKHGKRPFVVTFYSFKGGVGRSTSLAFVANILATRGHRVVMIDFDLEAPGLSFAHTADNLGADMPGVLDYLHQRYVLPGEDKPGLQDCLRQITLSARGELYLIPAGAYDEGYIHRLADLDVRALYHREANPIRQLVEDVKRSLDPDIILIDARTGFTDMGAVALFDLADLGMICFSPTRQSYAGLQWVVEAASKQRKCTGIPDLRFLLTPMPPVAQVQQQEWLGQASDWIAEHWDIPPALTVDEFYYHVPYDPNIIALDSLFADVPENILKSYEPVADAISASLPEEIPAAFAHVEGGVSRYRQDILHELRFSSPTAQDIDGAEIPTMFQRTGDFSQFLQEKIWVVLGAKGTGKTLLFRLFVEQSAYARDLAKPLKNLHKVQFLPAHGPLALQQTFLARGSLEDFEESAGGNRWAQFWPQYLLLQLLSNGAVPDEIVRDSFVVQHSALPDLSQEQILRWLQSRLASAYSASRTLDELHAIDDWLGQEEQHAWVFYDELDVSFGDRESRRNALTALLEWWQEVGPTLKNISPKIFLRSDIWTDLNLTNKNYYNARSLSLRWEEADLWRLVLRQALGTSETLAKITRQLTTVEKERLDTNLPIETLRQALYPLWGARMGRTNKAWTHNWMMKRIGDYKNNRFPRSLIQLLQGAVEIELGIVDQNPPNQPHETVLRPRSLINALPFVPEQRVGEVRNEYREFAEFLDTLGNERSPLAFEHLKEIWVADVAELHALVSGMIGAGILREYPYPPRMQSTDPQRYSVAELYLSGLRMTRRGRS